MKIEDNYIVAQIDGIRFLDPDTGVYHAEKSGLMPDISLPVLHDGTIFGLSNKSLIAFDISVSSERWNHPYRNKIPPCCWNGVEGVAVSGNTVVYTTFDSINAHDGVAGHAKWTVLNGKLISLPVAEEGRLFYIDNTSLRAVDIETGVEIWSFTIPKTASGLK